MLILAVVFAFLGRAYFPRTDPGQFVINVKMPGGKRIEMGDKCIAMVEAVIRGVVSPKDLGMIVSNIGLSMPVTVSPAPMRKLQPVAFASSSSHTVNGMNSRRWLPGLCD